MTFNGDMKRQARILGYELICKSAYGARCYCYRPMLFDSSGRETVRYAPDPCEFKYTNEEVRMLMYEQMEDTA